MIRGVDRVRARPDRSGTLHEPLLFIVRLESGYFEHHLSGHNEIEKPLTKIQSW